MTTHFRSALALTLLGSISAQADITMVHKMESPYQNLTSTTRIKGDKVRTDLGDMSTTIIDSKTGDQIMIIHATKSVTRTSGAEAKKSMEEAKKLMEQIGAPATAQVKMTATGKTEKVGALDTTLHKLDMTGVSTTFYVAKDYPNYAAIKKELDALNKLPGQSTEVAALDGMVVKSVTEAAGTKTTMTLVSLKQEPIDDSVFTVAEGK